MPQPAPDHPPEHVNFNTAFALPKPEPLPPPPPPPRREQQLAIAATPVPPAGPKPGTAPLVPRSAKPIITPIPIAPRVASRKPDQSHEEKVRRPSEEAAPSETPKTNGALDHVAPTKAKAEPPRTIEPAPKTEEAKKSLPPAPALPDEAPPLASQAQGSPIPAPEDSQPSAAAEGAGKDETSERAASEPAEATQPEEAGPRPEPMRKSTRRRSKTRSLEGRP